ncbi:EaE protein [Salmonella phage S137]|nr:EaE protein [Salmonella phage S137]
MRGLSYDPGILPSEMIIRHRFKPINDIPREEMLKRNSFPSVNEKQISECNVAEWEEMKEVKIYTIVSDQLSPPITGESFCTDMVRHSDYAELEAKYAALAEVRESARNEGINYAASRLAAAFNHGFLDKPVSEVLDVTRMILSAKEDLANNPLPTDDGLSGEYAEKSIEEWADQIRKGVQS